MCALLEINETRTTSFRPSANGQVERLNYSIAQIICCFVGEKQERWDEYVGLAASAIRASTVNSESEHKVHAKHVNVGEGGEVPC